MPGTDRAAVDVTRSRHTQTAHAMVAWAARDKPRASGHLAERRAAPRLHGVTHSRSLRENRSSRRGWGTALALVGLSAGLQQAARMLACWPHDPISATRNLALTVLIGAATLMLLTLTRPALRRRLRSRWFGRFMVTLAATLAAIGCAEVGARLLPRNVDQASDDRITFDRPLVVPDERLGYRLRSGCAVHMHREHTDGTKPQQDVGCTLDESGWRHTPLARQDGHDRAVWLSGCSHTFGHGIGDEQTVAAHYSRACPEDHVTNLGVPGWGPHHLLALLQAQGEPPLPNLGQPPIVTFLWIDHHLDRITGSLRVRNTYGIEAPSYELAADGTVRWLGPVFRAEPVRTAWYWLLGKSALVERSGFNGHDPTRADRLDLAAGIFRQIAQTLARRYGARLLLAQFPDEELGSQIAIRLRDTDIAFANLTGAFSQADISMRIDDCGHPSPAAARLLGESIAHAVQANWPR